jgi:prophage regulatory protein
MAGKSDTTAAAAASATTTSDERLLSMKQVCQMTSWSRASIYRLIDDDAFPMPVRLGEFRIAFRESQVRAYIASRCEPARPAAA